MSEWKKVKLGELCDFINGGAWSDKEYALEGISVLKVTNCKSIIDSTKGKIIFFNILNFPTTKITPIPRKYWNRVGYKAFLDNKIAPVLGIMESATTQIPERC